LVEVWIVPRIMANMAFAVAATRQQNLRANQAVLTPAMSPPAAAPPKTDTGMGAALAAAGLSLGALGAAMSRSRRKPNLQKAATTVVACRSLAKLKIDQVDVKGKRVFIRVDFNVPQDKKRSQHHHKHGSH